ncbi:response regulator [bacterium]|jgi:DNA-binding response OmpR family regulator|nr:response regulator [bacterium]MBT4250737.1 response regulator [bacterium]MBT4598180.1 response regulator [bacterium]MBT6753778.1 response regulator [bacterium]MBT7037509.1 response regulator [bacterium]
MSEKAKKILVIEDDKFISEVYIARLSKEGFETVLVGDGEAAIKKAKEETPDLILLDIFIPKIGGMDVLRVLKEKDETRNIPVVMLTNATEEEYIDNAMGMGAVDYLVKSNYTPEEIVHKVLEHCK